MADCSCVAPHSSLLTWQPSRRWDPTCSVGGCGAAEAGAGGHHGGGRSYPLTSPTGRQQHGRSYLGHLGAMRRGGICHQHHRNISAKWLINRPKATTLHHRWIDT